jgi:hypothetical protein
MISNVQRREENEDREQALRTGAFFSTEIELYSVAGCK